MKTGIAAKVQNALDDKFCGEHRFFCCWVVVGNMESINVVHDYGNGPINKDVLSTFLSFKFPNINFIFTYEV